MHNRSFIRTLGILFADMVFSRLCDASPTLLQVIWSAAVALLHAFDKLAVVSAVLIARYRPAEI